jgi:hypothetical protein
MLKRYSWIIVVILIVWILYWSVSLVRGEDFFFANWKPQKMATLPNGMIELVLLNPEEGKITKVKVWLSPAREVLGYAFLDPNLKIFVLEEGRYQETIIKSCLECHK